MGDVDRTAPLGVVVDWNLGAGRSKQPWLREQVAALEHSVSRVVVVHPLRYAFRGDRNPMNLSPLAAVLEPTAATAVAVTFTTTAHSLCRDRRRRCRGLRVAADVEAHTGRPRRHASNHLPNPRRRPFPSPGLYTSPTDPTHCSLNRFLTSAFESSQPWSVVHLEKNTTRENRWLVGYIRGFRSGSVG